MARAVAVSLFVICSVLGVLQHCQCSHQPEEKPEAAVNTFKDTAVTRKHRATRKPVNHPTLQQVVVPHNISTDVTDTEFEEFVRDNLTPDLAKYSNGEATINAVIAMAKDLKQRPRERASSAGCYLVVVRNGTAKSLHNLYGNDKWGRFGAVARTIGMGAAAGREYPNTAFVFNTDDLSVCTSKEACPAPMFSIYKRQDHLDLLLPVLNHPYPRTHHPWEQKVEKAFGRAGHNFDKHTFPNGMGTRAWLAHATKDHQDIIDFGLTRPRFDTSEDKDRPAGWQDIQPASFVSMEDHAKYKYLLSADGSTASSRLAKLLLTNSVTFKEESGNIEYYYRSLKPWQHYVPLPPGEAAVAAVEKAVARLKEDDRLAQNITRNAQGWAAKHAILRGRSRYLHRAVVEYTRLFPKGAMAAWVAAGGPEELAKELDKLPVLTRSRN